MKNILLSLCFLPSILLGADVALHIKLNTESALRGDTVDCTISLLNEGASSVSNLAVQVVFAAGLKFVSPTSEIGKFNPKTKLWTVTKLTPKQKINTLQGRIIVLGEGPLLVSAELLRMGEKDDDSAPGNQLLYEDDMAYTCISVPIVFCGTDNVNLTAEAFPGFEGYQWKYEGEAIAGATKRQLRITKEGRYSCTAKNTTFSFPVVVEKAPAFSIELGRSKSVCAGDRIRMTVVPTGGTKPFNYSWTNDKGHNLSKALKAGQNLTIMATVRDARGCIAKDTVDVKVKNCREKLRK